MTPASSPASAPASAPSEPPLSGPLRLAVIPGDGIGQEVTAEALKVLEAVAPVAFETTRYDLGAERYLATGEVLPDSVLAEIRGHDAILLGAVGGKPGDPNLPPGISITSPNVSPPRNSSLFVRISTSQAKSPMTQRSGALTGTVLVGIRTR